MKLKTLLGKVCHHVVNMRAHQRKPHQGTVMVSWRQAGELITIRSSFRDLSESGAGIAAPESFKSGQTVRLHSAALNGARIASVRYCRRDGESFHVGLEFTNVSDLAPICQLKEMETLLEGLHW